MEVNESLAGSMAQPGRAKAWMPVLLLLLVWALTLVPSALFGQWFTLDMGGVFTQAAHARENLLWALSPYGKEGRYFPAYWLYHFGLFGVFSTHVAGYYAVQAALFMLSLALTCYLFFRITNHLAGTLVLGVAAPLGGAVAECLYTVGKGEPLAYLFLIAAIVLFHRMERTISWRLGLRLAAIGVLMALAQWTKETSLVMVVFAPVAVLTAAFVEGQRVRDALRSRSFLRYGLLLACVFGGILLSKAPYLLFPKQGNSTAYVDYRIDLDLVLDNLSFYAAQQPDVLLFGLASLWLLGLLVIRMRAAPERFAQKSRQDVAFVTGLLAIAWGYYAGLLIWRWPMGYYMLLPSIMFKFTAIYGFLTAHRAGLLGRGAIRACASFLVVAIAYALVQAFYMATSQISYSRMYTEAIARYLEVAPPASRLVFENFPFYSEEVTNTQQVIEILTGETRKTAGIGDIVNPATVNPDIAKLLRITQRRLDENVASLPRAGDYLLVMTGNKIATWFVRGVCPMFSDDSVLLKQNAYDMMPIAENRLFVPGIFLSVWTYHVMAVRTYVGFKLYRVTSDRPRHIWRGRYPDEWTQKSASLQLFPDFGKHARVTLSTPAFNSPNRVTITQDGKLVRDLTLIAGNEVTLDLDNTSGEKPTRIEFSVARTVVPKKIKLNDDKRELGVLVHVEPRE